MLAVFIGKEVTDLAMPQDTAVSSQGNNRPELHLFDKQIELANTQESLLNARLFPKLSVFAQDTTVIPVMTSLMRCSITHGNSTEWSVSGCHGT